ncbi:hypothetical protein PAPYR_10429 [Paratrimastix pyriformis]|uniref:Uncharacterized protein n=1 Tax=Paratrimastix pyriformis TaxID=342808 RepID=A0ABQ8U605_9EUKA|nr:hypothetical protein PAPYR_10429 [Paratrimastix pyriformis]
MGAAFAPTALPHSSTITFLRVVCGACILSASPATNIVEVSELLTPSIPPSSPSNDPGHPSARPLLALLVDATAAAALGKPGRAHLYFLSGPLILATWRAQKPEIYKALSPSEVFLQSHADPAGIMIYLPRNDFEGAGKVARTILSKFSGVHQDPGLGPVVLLPAAPFPVGHPNKDVIPSGPSEDAASDTPERHTFG